jgi:succinate dehydrogenase / fumarate reductase flavoprotein subunit
VRVEGNRHYNPGWHLALDLHSLLTFAEAATLAAIERKESRGGHTRDDYPNTDAKFAKVNVIVRLKNGELGLSQEPLPEVPDELKALLEEKK